MRLVGQQPFKSLQPGDVSGFELPMFTVLTGKNGAGKSNLLGALATNAIVVDSLGALQGQQVRLFSLGQLLAAAEGPVVAGQYKETWAQAYNHLQGLKQVVVQNAGTDAANQDTWVEENLDSSRMLSHTGAARMRQATGKRLLDTTLEEFRSYAPLLSGIRDPFSASTAEIFLSYAGRRWSNSVMQFRDSRTGSSTALTDDEFTSKFGRPPWELLDDTLQIVGLPYTFVQPPEDIESANYEALLLDDNGVSISPGDLSSGERVLLAVAMSLFTGANMGEAIELPRLLMLDEADASLHPSMVKSLLTVVEEIFVKQYGVMVIMATHSPTTVALAPEESLHVMSRTAPKIQKTTADEALQVLTVGISSLSVKIENRRQVFVESEYDQAVYQELFALLKAKLKTDKSAEFIAAGRRDIGGGCDAVKKLVTDLRSAGVDTVYGIVDRDNREESPANVIFVADRYAIENLLFDPALLGTFLIREQIVKPEDLGVALGTRSFELKSTHIESMAKALCDRLGLDAEPKVSVVYAGGFEVEIPEAFMETQGHTLETQIVTEFPQLKAFKTQLKTQVVKRAVGDQPDFVPQAVLDVFEAFE